MRIKAFYLVFFLLLLFLLNGISVHNKIMRQQNVLNAWDMINSAQCHDNIRTALQILQESQQEIFGVAMSMKSECFRLDGLIMKPVYQYSYKRGINPFLSTHWQGAKILFSDFNNISMAESFLGRSEISSSHFDNAVLTGGALNNSVIVSSVFDGADMNSMNLQSSTFTFSSLENINAQHSNFENVFLGYTSLKNSDFTDANFTGASLEKSNIENANFTNVKGLTCDMLKKGENWDKAITDLKCD